MNTRLAPVAVALALLLPGSAQAVGCSEDNARTQRTFARRRVEKGFVAKGAGGGPKPAMLNPRAHGSPSFEHAAFMNRQVDQKMMRGFHRAVPVYRRWETLEKDGR